MQEGEKLWNDIDFLRKRLDEQRVYEHELKLKFVDGVINLSRYQECYFSAQVVREKLVDQYLTLYYASQTKERS